LEDAAKKLNISYKYLRALETGEYDKLPEGVYGKNFLREYAFFLGFSRTEYNELANDFSEEKNIIRPFKKRELFSKQRVKKRYFLAVPKIFKSAAVVFISAVCFIYLGFKVDKAISPPQLFVYSPAENLATTERFIEVAGKTEPESSVAINGEQILSNQAGEFAKQVDLKNGINTIIIISSKKYGRDNTIIRQVMVANE
ncbi:helix-turn-helix domain-containing protein, partial [Patescibacteria group bacterium]|nr:helix-turn-helix domain-containing protein [Patescibacteria group bacterium]MBU4600634.1 helix-turn-helix domain-containing protein [Patescibacteria group bacterium]